jgi:hypothetical protein
MFLIDTNVWLERLLDQDQSAAVKSFLDVTPADELRVTDFSFHSIGVILSRLGRGALLSQFVRDVFIDSGAALVALEPADMDRLIEIMADCRLDFDDAYQCTAAEKFDLQIVSFDHDFDRTPRKRILPEEAERRVRRETGEG